MTATPASSARDDTATLAAIGVAAACLAATAHEAVGHGGACLAVGGRVALLSNVFFHCQGGAPIVDLAGPLGNLGMALVALAGLLVWRGAGQASKLFLTALLAFSAFWGAGYLLLCGLTGQGDFAFWARDALATPAAVWRPIMIAAGLGLYTGAVFVVARLAPRGPAGEAPAHDLADGRARRDRGRAGVQGRWPGRGLQGSGAGNRPGLAAAVVHRRWSGETDGLGLAAAASQLAVDLAGDRDLRAVRRDPGTRLALTRPHRRRRVAP
ncbi:hypothetical protein [Caulobacter sp. DWR2-3-1b2]|uniref:hypothetical protein n=1 Tax=Caulobacter sp. DWR2-3-1b2 TaxID=2804642 RepID=UPI003CFA0FF0